MNVRFPDRQTVERVRSLYPQGARVELVSMSDPYAALKPGDRGMVDFVDDTGTVFVDWDSGSTLGAVYGADSIRLLTKAEIIREQCVTTAKTGRTNMFDAKVVCEIALEMGFHELAGFILTRPKAYSAMILTGELADKDIG